MNVTWQKRPARGRPGVGAASGRGFYLAVLLGCMVLHAVLAAAVPVSGDEAYYWDCSRHPDWSYHDQPPLVMWMMVPFRALLGETSLAVRAPAILASLALGMCLLPLLRRLGGGAREAALAYLALHGTPLFFLGSFYASTDVVMSAAYVACTWAAVAVGQGESRAWWGFAAAIGIGFLAKFSIVLVLPALLPVILRRDLRGSLARPTPWLAALLAAVITAPVWIWAVQHDWVNLGFQLAGRHQREALGLRYLSELVAGNLILLTPFLGVAAGVAWLRAWRRRVPGNEALLVAAVAPLLVFATISLWTRVGAHWTAPGFIVAMVVVVREPFRGRCTLLATGMAAGLLLSAAVLGVVAAPERAAGVEWRYGGRPHRISTGKLVALIGNTEIARQVAIRRRPGELVASESYSTVHLLAFMSGGNMATRLAHVKPGKHGLASLYWHRPGDLKGADVLFVTEKRQVDERLRDVFAEVAEEPPIEIVRGGRVERTVRVLRCRNLLRPEGVFTRLGASKSRVAPGVRAGGTADPPPAR